MIPHIHINGRGKVFLDNIGVKERTEMVQILGEHAEYWENDDDPDPLHYLRHVFIEIADAVAEGELTHEQWVGAVTTMQNEERWDLVRCLNIAGKMSRS